MERLKPQLETLRETYKDDPSELAARTMALQRANGITIFDKVSVLNTATLPSAIGLYWATSNALTVIQTLALRSLLARKHTPLAA
jgi:membrane protein insertase Oxa1/YidC/SpoIIIJ